MTLIHEVDIVTSDISHVTKYHNYLCVIHVICVKLYIYIYLHSAKHRMRHNPGKIVTNGCKVHV